jgi:hypothetical protein
LPRCLIEYPSPHDPRRRRVASGRSAADGITRATPRRGRRGRTPPERGVRRGVLALVLLLHLLFLAALWSAMQPGPVRPVADEGSDATVLHLRFVPRTATPAPPPPPTVPPPSAAASPRRVVRETPRPDAMQVEAPAPATSTAKPIALFDRDGVAQLPSSAATAQAPPPDYIQRKPTGDMQVMDHRSPLPYKATRFEKYFPPPGENAAEAGLRKVIQALHGKGSSEKTVNLPRGVHLKCKTLLGIPTPLCGLPPAPPPPNDGDERLSMPSAPLAKDPHPPPPPSLQTCIAAWRSQGPLPYGCPVDTPTRAVDEEIRECVALYRAGKRLKTWCPADTAQRAAAAPADRQTGH